MVSMAKGPDKRAAILDAAQVCFARHGVRRTAIEDVAREAGVAKGTVYLYFASKEKLFAALASELCREALREVRAALAAPGTLSRRLAGALDAKIGRFHRLLAGSPHAAELLETKATMAARSFQELDSAFREALDRALADANLPGGGRARAQLLDLVLAAGYGTARFAELRGERSSKANRVRLERHLDLLLGRPRRTPTRPAARAGSRAAR